jgi:outer membrane autotransporter protein
LTPFAGLQATVVSAPAFTETGAGTLSLAVAGETTSSVRSIFGAEADQRWGGVSLALRAGWAHDYADTARPVTASFVGGPASFTVNGAAPARDSAIIGLGIEAPVLDRTSVFLRYDGDLGGNGNVHAVTGGVRLTW